MAQDECCPAADVPGMTDDLLSDFLVGNSLREVLDDVTRIAEEEADLEALRRPMAAVEEPLAGRQRSVASSGSRWAPMAAGAAAGSCPCSSSATVCLGSTRVAPLAGAR